MSGIIGGLLGGLKAPRPCIRSHGQMDEIQGLWKLDQVEASKNQLLSVGQYMPTGLIFTIGIARCPTCGYIEMFDKDA